MTGLYQPARVAQLVERGTSNAEVFSSNLDVSISFLSFCYNLFGTIFFFLLFESCFI